jgi:hypothetical protein
MPIADIIPLLQEAADTIDSDADDVTFLNCLLNAGVDNWDWYDEAVSEYHASMASDQNIVGSA